MTGAGGSSPTGDGEVVAIIASFRPPEQLAHTVAGLVAQFAHVVVVDDGSALSSRPILDAAEAAGATVLRLPENRGIAATLNAGIRFARERWDPEFLATFDQDSVPASDYAPRAVAAFRAATAAGIRVGCVVAASYSGRKCRTRPGRHRFPVALDPMQSGFVIPRETLDAVGLLAEDFVIDGVDSEFTARARAAGRDAIVGDGCDIDHQLGRRDPAVLFGKPVRFRGRVLSYNYHSPQRVYYIVRNGVTLTRRYTFKDPIWVGLRLVEEAKAHLLRLTFSPSRLALLHAMKEGLVDGVARRGGPAPQHSGWAAS